MLRTALGVEIAAWLDDQGVVEIMLNPDGRLWLDRLTSGLEDTGARLSAEDGERIVRLVAHHVGAEVHAGAPRVSAELPETGERFEGLLPPIVYGARLFHPQARCRRVHARRLCRRWRHVGSSKPRSSEPPSLSARMSSSPAAHRPARRRSPTPCWPKSPRSNDRVVLIEDTRELQCAAPNLVSLRTKDGVASLSDLVRSSLRLRPDRIPIGEVRGSEALDLLKAWGTGHPGGVGTIHAGSALGALRRLEQLIQEAVVTVPRALIAETIQIIAVLAGRGSERRLIELAAVTGLNEHGDYALVDLTRISFGDDDE